MTPAIDVELQPTENNVLVQFSDAVAAAIAPVAPAIVTVNARPRKPSSGIHWQSGIVLTAEYTVKREDDITVTLPSGETVNATLVGRDKGTDLAILQIENADFPTAPIGDAAMLQVGQILLAVGRTERGIGASMGILNSFGGAWRSWYGGKVDQFVRPDLTLYPGFAGGALVDAMGRVMGMNTTGPRDTVLTIPTATIQRVMAQLMQRGQIVRGYLGVGMQPVRLPEGLVRSLALTQTTGVIVISVEPDSPADRAGVLLGDILLALRENPVTDVRDVFAQLDPDQVGKTLTAQIVRGGVRIEVPIVVGERPRSE